LQVIGLFLKFGGMQLFGFSTLR